MLAHLVIDLLVAQIARRAQASTLRQRYRFAREIVGILRDGGDHGLYRREPQRQMAGIMLKHDAKEALHRAANGTMNHYRCFFAAVGGDVESLEALRQVEIDLRG